MGFANKVIGGAAALIRSAIRSPNFVSGSAGWSLNKDGTLEANNAVIRNGQVISGTSLYYSGAPAAGNLIYSVSAAAGTDGFGNKYLAGSASYVNSAGVPQFASAVQGGDVALYTWNAGSSSWAAGPVISTDASGNLLVSTSAGFMQVSGDVQEIGTIWADTWHTISSFSAGFSAGAPAPQYSVEAIGTSTGTGNPAHVRLRGQVLLTGATGADAQMFSLPVTFARNQDYVTPNNLSGYTAGQRVVRVAASGAVRCEPTGSNTNFVLLDGIVAPMS